MENNPFVVVSGLPGSGKTTLARQLAVALSLPLVDKDDILGRLFDSAGVGDAAWRRRLSREADAILQVEAKASRGAVLTSFWYVRGMPTDSGTPTDWLDDLSGLVVHVHCVCSPEVAAARFTQRTRHPGHLDASTTHADVLVDFYSLVHLGPPDLGERIDVDTSYDSNAAAVVGRIRSAFTRCLTKRAADGADGAR